MSAPRVLATCFPQSGHLHPLIPTARALADAGCQVLVATSVSQHGTLTAAGLEAIDLGPSHEQNNVRMPEIMPRVLAAPTAQQRAIVFAFVFGTLYASAIAEELYECARAWNADAILAGLESLAGPLVAARLQRPLVVNGFGTGLSRDVYDAAASAVEPVWKRAGMRVSPGAGVFDGLYVDPCPPSLHPEDVPVPAHSCPIRPAQFDGTGELPPLPQRRPLVYVTLGTNRRFATPARLRRIAKAIDACGAGAVITGVAASELGALPDDVTAHAFVPQSLILPHCDAVICHAGASTLFGALAVGVPLVLIPLGADHHANTAAAVRRGVAVGLEDAADENAIAEALARVLSDPRFRSAASAVGAEIAAMPDATTHTEEILGWLGRR